MNSVSISPGLRMDDRFAGRLVDALACPLALLSHPKTILAAMANPIAQRRVFDRAVKQFGPWMLASYIETGKRGKVHDLV